MKDYLVPGIIMFLIIAPIVGLFALLSSSASPEEPYLPPPSPAYSTITANDAVRLMDELDYFILLDTRTQEEFDEEHIPGAILIPYDELRERAVTELTDLSVPIFVYCRTGNRSAYSAYILASLGFTRVYDFGGIEDYPRPTTSSQTDT